MKSGKEIIAILLADIHLSEQPPRARVEEDWFGCMKRQLNEVKRLSWTPPRLGEGGPGRRIPIIAAGDIFDHWGPKPALINFAIQNMPTVYAVPGNHDLPNHRYTDIGKSAYQTLMEAGKIINIEPGKPIELPDSPPIRLHGFPCGFPVKPLEKPNDLFVEVAVVHDYIWTKDSRLNTGFEGAPIEKTLAKRGNILLTYDVSVWGDNHKGFAQKLWRKQKSHFMINCGTFYRRRIDEIDYKPSVGLLHADGSITLHFLDCSEDKFIDQDKSKLESIIGDREAVDALLSLADVSIDFPSVLRRMAEREDLREPLRKIYLAVLEELKCGT